MILTSNYSRMQNRAFVDLLNEHSNLKLVTFMPVGKASIFLLIITGIFGLLFNINLVRTIIRREFGRSLVFYSNQYYIRNNPRYKFVPKNVLVYLYTLIVIGRLCFLDTTNTFNAVFVSHDPYTIPKIIERYALIKGIKRIYARPYGGDKFTRINVVDADDAAPNFCEVIHTSREARKDHKLFKVKKIKRVVIFAHEFFDAPAIMGEVAYPSYLEWIESTINHCVDFNVELVVKRHPFGTNERNNIVWRSLKQRYSHRRITFIESNVPACDLCTHTSLNITFRGTVALELISNGYHVLNCAESPFSETGVVDYSTDQEEYLEKITKSLTNGIPEKYISSLDIEICRKAFTGENLKRTEVFNFSFDVLPETAFVNSIYERVELEQSDEYYFRWKEYYKNNTEFHRFVKSVCI